MRMNLTMGCIKLSILVGRAAMGKQLQISHIMRLNVVMRVNMIMRMNVLMRVMGIMMNTVASAPPPRILELQDGVEAGPEPHPRLSTRTESKYLQS